MNQISHYLTPDGQDLYQNWLNKHRMAKARVTTRVNRVTAGAFGDCKPVGDGVWELRIDYGDTECITPKPVNNWCCSCWEAISAGSKRTSRKLLSAGKITSGGNHEQIT